MVTRSIRFSDELFEELTLAADSRDVSFHWLVIKLIDEGVKRLDHPDNFSLTRP